MIFNFTHCSIFTFRKAVKIKSRMRTMVKSSAYPSQLIITNIPISASEVKLIDLNVNIIKCRWKYIDNIIDCQ